MNHSSGFRENLEDQLIDISTGRELTCFYFTNSWQNKDIHYLENVEIIDLKPGFVDAYLLLEARLFCGRSLTRLFFGNFFEFFVGKNCNFNTAVLLTTINRFIGGNWLGFAITLNSKPLD